MTPAQRLQELRKRAAERRRTYGDAVNNESPDIPDWLRDLQWQTDAWQKD